MGKEIDTSRPHLLDTRYRRRAQDDTLNPGQVTRKCQRGTAQHLSRVLRPSLVSPSSRLLMRVHLMSVYPRAFFFFTPAAFLLIAHHAALPETDKRSTRTALGTRRGGGWGAPYPFSVCACGRLPRFPSLLVIESPSSLLCPTRASHGGTYQQLSPENAIHAVLCCTPLRKPKTKVCSY